MVILILVVCLYILGHGWRCGGGALQEDHTKSCSNSIMNHHFQLTLLIGGGANACELHGSLSLSLSAVPFSRTFSMEYALAGGPSLHREQMQCSYNIIDRTKKKIKMKNYWIKE